MSSPLGNSVVKRLNFSAPDPGPSPSPFVQLAPRRPVTPARGANGTPTAANGHAGIVRYGLPEGELQHSVERRNGGGSRSVSYRAPDDDDDLDDCDSPSEATSARPAIAVCRPDAVEEQKRLLEQRLLASLETRQHTKQAALHARMAEVESQLAAKLSVVASSLLRKQSDLQREDQEQLQAQQQRRRELLERVQHSHRTEASLQEQQMQRLMAQREEATRRQQEEERKRREAEEERRREAERAQQRAEAERQRQEAEARKAKEDASERARQEAQAAEERRQQEAKKKAAAGGAQAHPCLRLSPAAGQRAAQAAARLAELQAAVQPLQADEGCKRQRRDIERKLTVHVQQIAGTQQQVGIKCRDLYGLLSGLAGAWRSFAVLTLAGKALKQQELVQLNNKAAFPLALVLVNVSAHFPELLECTLALLYKACPLAIPRAYLHDQARITNNAYYRGMGFEEQDDPSAPTGKVFESPDEYVKRLEGLMLIYGAIMQVDEPNAHGIAHAWSYLARLLNSLPVDRFSAKALIAVLRVAGHALFARYRGQFVKMLAAVRQQYVPALRASNAEDVGALATLLDSYVADSEFRRQPEGRDLPANDASSRQENRA